MNKKNIYFLILFFNFKNNFCIFFQPACHVPYLAVLGIVKVNKALFLLSALLKVSWVGYVSTYCYNKNTYSCLNITPQTKGHMNSECIYDIIDFPKYHHKNLIDFCPESLFRLGMLCTHLSRVALRIIKTNHMYLVYKTFQGRNLSNFFGGILEKSMIS